MDVICVCLRGGGGASLPPWSLPAICFNCLQVCVGQVPLPQMWSPLAVCHCSLVGASRRGATLCKAWTVEQEEKRHRHLVTRSWWGLRLNFLKLRKPLESCHICNPLWQHWYKASTDIDKICSIFRVPCKPKQFSVGFLGFVIRQLSWYTCYLFIRNYFCDCMN